MLERFRLEGRAAAAIGHPGIVDVLDLGATAEGAAFIVMELLHGETLSSRISRDGRLELPLVVWLAHETLTAIAAAHERGVVHRDLKPDNLFLADRPAPAVKILDFGISRFRRPDDVALTRTGVVMGTPLYMSPEQARGAKDVGPATDLYSLGAILFHSLCGLPPFVGDSYNEVLSKVLTEAPRPLLQERPDAPPELARLVDLLLSKSPAGRPADARAALALLPPGGGPGLPLAGAGLDATMKRAPWQVPTPRPQEEVSDTKRSPLREAPRPVVLAPLASSPAVVAPLATPGRTTKEKLFRLSAIAFGLFMASRCFGRSAPSPSNEDDEPVAIHASGGKDGKPALSELSIGGYRFRAEGGGKGKPGRVRFGKKPAGLQLHAEPKEARWSMDGDALECESNDCVAAPEEDETHTYRAAAPGFQSKEMKVRGSPRAGATLVLAPQQGPDAAPTAPPAPLAPPAP